MKCANTRITYRESTSLVDMMKDSVEMKRTGLLMDTRSDGTQDMRWLYDAVIVFTTSWQPTPRPEE